MHFWFIFKLDHFSEAQRGKHTTETFEILLDSSKTFDYISANDRNENLFKYLGLFVRTDPVPEDFYGCSDDSDTFN